MRWPKKHYLLSAVAIVAVALLIIHSRDDEPRYQDRTLSQWLVVYESGYEESKVAYAAIACIGTNAVPWLVEWIAYTPPRWRIALRDFGRVGRRWVPDWVTDIPAAQRANAAELGFAPLGPVARSAIPVLAKLANDPSWARASRAIRALYSIGPEALPSLLQVVANTAAHPAARFLAGREMGDLVSRARSMGTLGDFTAQAVPLLVQNLTEEDENLAAQAAITLEILATNPEISVPALAQALEGPTAAIRANAAHALMSFRDKALPAMPGLIRALGDPSIDVRKTVTNCLQRLAPEVFTNAPAH